MFLKSRSILLAAALLAAPLASAIAQQNNPAGNMGSNSSVTATPSTADTSSRGMAASNYSGSAMNSTTPGSTGHTVVPGSTSSQASTSNATNEQKMGSQTTGGK